MPKSHSHKRNGADAAFARAIARAEFGRFYCDENDLREVRRSMARREKPAPIEPTKVEKTVKRDSAAKPKAKPAIRAAPRLKERRTELADAFARLRGNRS